MPPTLETSRLILRGLGISDLTAVFNYSSNPEYAQFLPYSSVTSIEELNQFFKIYWVVKIAIFGQSASKAIAN